MSIQYRAHSISVFLIGSDKRIIHILINYRGIQYFQYYNVLFFYSFQSGVYIMIDQLNFIVLHTLRFWPWVDRY